MAVGHKSVQTCWYVEMELRTSLRQAYASLRRLRFDTHSSSTAPQQQNNSNNSLRESFVHPYAQLTRPAKLIMPVHAKHCSSDVGNQLS